MTEFTSDVKTIPYDDGDIFRVLSDMNNLEWVKDQLPEDKISGFTFDRDGFSFHVEPIGVVTFLIVTREPNKFVKFQSQNLPFEAHCWIQLVQKEEKDTKMKVTFKADINPFLRSMVSKPIQQAVDKIAETLAALPYSRIGESR
ncbi:MAG TPA: polyketide cyclase [Porphyromonadaceae bacterium]|jgi:carbon monoxide dehydrogenase subunit G|uniref:SRPBCC family protein n=1 Tax=Limibacterium fermenti TaxID=3229863 RepID=UPI000E938583|nr:polyketide cyclase [Porphyromonadaceae bacterium]HBK31989.1 polyketide cyclase [Porphyromonadaceae bacterium]HBL34706.1 polyketide cyclase [Porphyromonadaceae bacterium]HBX19099.1 polyketide cyclase [Porphyromonadaceae bacterium]HBX21967.1 polyketide cyclase [Porphyromonadaceae bacterium]